MDPNKFDTFLVNYKIRNLNTHALLLSRNFFQVEDDRLEEIMNIVEGLCNEGWKPEIKYCFTSKGILHFGIGGNGSEELWNYVDELNDSSDFVLIKIE